VTYARSGNLGVALSVLAFLVPSDPASAWENTAGEVEWLHKLTLRYETPHIKWAKPYARGKVKALYFIASPFQGMGTHAREAVELMQRFDVQVEAVFYYNFYRKDWFGGVAGHRRLDRIMRENRYDVYIFQDVSPKLLETCWLGKGPANALRPAVEQGMGVVLIGTDHGEMLKGRKQVEELPAALSDGPAAEAATLGKGRIVQMPARPEIPHKVGWQVEYENWQYELGRAVLWAAGAEPEASVRLSVPKEIPRENLPGKLAEVSWAAMTPEDAAVCRVSLRRWDGCVWDLGEFSDGKGSEPQLPKLKAGRYHLDAILRGKRGVEAFATRPFTVTAPTTIKALTLATEWAEVGDALSGTVELAGAKEGQTLRVRLADRDGRELVRSDVSSKTDGTAHPFRFTVEPWLPMLPRVEAAVVDGDGEVAIAYRFFNVTKRHRDKFHFVLWDFPVKATLGPYAAQTMKRLGVTAILCSKAAPRVAAAYDIAWVPWTGGQVRAGPHTEGWHRDNSIKYFLMRMKESRGHGVLTYSLGDEGAVEGAGVGAAAMAAYREYLKLQYENINALNQSWGTEFKAFDDVVLSRPKDTDEKASLESGNYSRWYDRQAFRSYNFVQYCVRHQQKLLEFDPKAVLGFEGSGRFARRGDPYLICKELQFWVPYGGSLDELVRSLTADKPDFLRGNWMGYHRTADGLCNKYWRMVVSGSSSVWWWMWSSIGAWQGLIAPDLGALDYVQEFVDDTAIVRNGLGPLLRKSQQLHDGIAMLHSKPSSYAVTLDNSPSYSDYEPNHRAWFNVIHDQPMEFRYVTARMLADREFRPEDYRLLILPQAVALGPKEAKVIREFVTNGGTVLADLRPGVYDDHVKPQERGMLDDLFGINGRTRQAAKKCDLRIEGKIGDAELKLEWPDLLVDPAVELDGGQAMGRAGDHPVCIVNQIGEGRAILLNWALSGFPSRTTARGLRTWGTAEETPFEIANFFKSLFAVAGAKPHVELIRYKSKNPYVGNIRLQRWRNGDVVILALHRETGQRQQVTVSRPEEMHVYDLRDRVYVGKTGRWMNQIIPSRARFFALLPERCPAPKVEYPESAARGERLRLRISVPGARGWHALKLEARTPDGVALEWWERTVLVRDKPEEVTLPVAYNDPTGMWTITLTDTFSPEARTTVQVEVR